MRKILSTLVLSVALFAISSSVFSSVIVGIDDTQYEVTVMKDTFEDLEIHLRDQIWWDNYELAVQFASAVGGQFGFENTLFGFPDGPYFAFETFFDDVLQEPAFNASTCSQEGSSCEIFMGIGPATDDFAEFEFYFAKATEVPEVPLPAAVWLFGSALAGIAGLARRKRN